MDTYTIDCTAISNEAELWQSYLSVTSPQGAAQFGRNIDALRDAICGGGPGWPGQCELHFSNTASLVHITDGKLYQALQSIAGSSKFVHIHID